jgi:hypothetical protein
MDYSIHINKYKHGQELTESLLDRTQNYPNYNYNNKQKEVIIANTQNSYLEENRLLKERAQTFPNSEELNLKLLFADNNLLLFLTAGTILSFILILFLIYIYQ